LLKVVDTTDFRRSIPNFLDGWKEQTNENGDDGDYNKQLNQSEGSFRCGMNCNKTI
jgi:hypothetical protein